jgi:hypothetical protein
LLHEFPSDIAISYEKIRQTIGSYLCLTNEGLEALINRLCQKYKEFVFKDDAGVKQIQLKNNKLKSKIDFLKNHYDLH